VIVGASLAEGSAAAALRQEGLEGRVVLVGAERQSPYERPPLSKEYMRGESPFENALLQTADFYDEYGIEPHFESPEYVGRLSDYQHELGLMHSRYAPQGSTTGPAGAVVYWHVDDVTTIFEKLLSMGAEEYEAPRDPGGFLTASAGDPFGNILAIMYNPNYVDVLGSTTEA
jgi:predicted enzyme related to lactoylglutathione lyase